MTFNVNDLYYQCLQQLLEFYNMYKLGDNEELSQKLQNFNLWRNLDNVGIQKAVICFIRTCLYGLNENFFEEI